MDKIRFNESGKLRWGVLVECKGCAKQYPVRTKAKTAKYCSIGCRGRSKRNRETFACTLCNKSFERAVSKKSNSRSGFYFCSRKCKDEAQKIGGIKEIMPPHYGTSSSPHYAPFSFLKRQENPQCTGCGETKKYLLCVHHKDGDRDNNVDSNFEIVCGNCHIKRHLKLVEGEWIYNTHILTPRELLLEV